MYLICSPWLAAGFSQVFFLIFFLYVSIIPACIHSLYFYSDVFHDIFLWCRFIHFRMYLLFKPLVFMVNLSFIYLNLF
jgi:hypothetical protein